MNYLQRFLYTGYDPRLFEVEESQLPIMSQQDALTPEQVEQWKKENEEAPPVWDQVANRERYGGTGPMGVSPDGLPYSPDPNAASGKLWSEPDMNTSMPIMGQSSGGNSMNSGGMDWGQIIGMLMQAYGGGR